jgi:peptide/nickel transport system ATP-binding protein
MTEQPLLRVEDLRVNFVTSQGVVAAVRGISFELRREKLAIVGESGSGKSQTGRALLGLIRPPGHVQAKVLEFAGIDLRNLPERQLRAIRGRRIAMILQDPKFSLNPVMTVGEQIIEAYRIHTGASRSQARDRALAMLNRVRIANPRPLLRAYPHQLSGGMGQRAMIAMMLISSPELLIADEPTSALDVTVRQQVLAILDQLVAESGMGLIFISHDLNLVASFCDRVLVMCGGLLIEEIPACRLHEARHPYTRALLNCVPTLTGRRYPLATVARESAWLTQGDGGA